LKVLKENEEGHHKLAEKLLEKEVIFGEDLETIFGKRPWQKDELPGNGNASEERTLPPSSELPGIEEKSE
jgi:cell division protease FtsH